VSDRLDRALEALDDGLELAAAPHYGEATHEGTAPCWRCTAADPSTDVGLCDDCFAAMRDEATTAPEPVDALALVDAILAAGGGAVRRVAAMYVGVEAWNYGDVVWTTGPWTAEPPEPIAEWRPAGPVVLLPGDQLVITETVTISDGEP
jgi:hypothetical protein